MRIGEYDKEINFYSPSSTRDGGEVVEGVTLVGADFAKFVTPKGDQAFEAGRNDGRREMRVGVRYRKDVEVGWTMEYQVPDGGPLEVYNIDDVDRTGIRKGELWFTVSKSGAR